MIDQAVAELARDFGLQPLDLLGLEFDHFPGAQIDEVVVVALTQLLIAGASLAELMPFDDAGVFEQVDRAVDRGD